MKKNIRFIICLFIIIGTYLSVNIYNNLKTNSISKYNVLYTKKKDKTPPVIKLKGDKKIKMYVGTKYKEPGYKVSDNSGEKLVKKVKIKSNLNVNKVGTYTIKYTVSDSSGNKSTVKRTVKVVETNIIRSMTWTGYGIKIKGYVDSGKKNYKIKVCNSENKCGLYKAVADGNEYSVKIDLYYLDYGSYTMKLLNKNKELDIIDKLPADKKIYRTRRGNKLLTMKYNGKNPSFKVEELKYEYDILIDVGHGGSDTGTKNKYILEKDLNLMQSLYEKKRYEDHGLKVLITRMDDSYGLMIGSSSLSRLHRKAMAMGYYGAVSKIVYGNHHNSTENKKTRGYEILLTNQGKPKHYKVEYNIAKEWNNIYPNLDKRTRIYGRNYDTDAILPKDKGQVYNIKNYYAVQRIPFELYGILTTTYEGCYLSNLDDYKWYIKNWKTLSEIKIKNYVESLGVEYKPV